MTWIYLSPHFDDAVFSCGGLIFEQASRGERVEVWTICGGEPATHQPLPPFAEVLHERWGTGPEAVAARRQEDIIACRRVYAHARHYPVPDAIYRRRPSGEPLINDDPGLFDASIEEPELAAEMAATLGRLLPPGAQVVSPLAIGGHVDHRLTYAIAQGLESSGAAGPLLYYGDYPYVLPYSEDLARLAETTLERIPAEISPAGLQAWQDAAAAYASQISTFWESVEEMSEMFRQYNLIQGGRLWKKREQPEPR